TITGGDMRGTGTTILNGPTSISSGVLGLDGDRVLKYLASIRVLGRSINLNNNINGTSLAGTGTITNTATGTVLASGSNVGTMFASDFGGADPGTTAVFNNAATLPTSRPTAGDITSRRLPDNDTAVTGVQPALLNP